MKRAMAPPRCGAATTHANPLVTAKAATEAAGPSGQGGAPPCRRRSSPVDALTCAAFDRSTAATNPARHIMEPASPRASRSHGDEEPKARWANEAELAGVSTRRPPAPGRRIDKVPTETFAACGAERQQVLMATRGTPFVGGADGPARSHALHFPAGRPDPSVSLDADRHKRVAPDPTSDRRRPRVGRPCAKAPSPVAGASIPDAGSEEMRRTMLEAPSDACSKGKRPPRRLRGGPEPRIAKARERVCCDDLDSTDFLTWLADEANEIPAPAALAPTRVRGRGS
jgi:hypothetical protein